MIIFATLDADGRAIELAPGLPFTTYSILISSYEEAAWSFTPIGERASYEANHSPAALDAYGEDDLDRYGIQALDMPNPPEGDRLHGYELVVAEGAISIVPTWEPVPPPPVPALVSRMQAKLALNAAGLLDDVETYMLTAPAETRIYWTEVSELHRNHPILTAATAAMGWSEGEVDDLFRAAAAIV